MNNKFTNSLFNYNINIDAKSQNYNMQSPIFGGNNPSTNPMRKSEEMTKQILINNNFINIQQTITDPNTIPSQNLTTKPDQNLPPGPEMSSRRKFYFKKGYQQQGPQSHSQPRRTSPTPITDDIAKLRLNLAKAHPSLERMSHENPSSARGYGNTYTKRNSQGEVSLIVTSNRSKTPEYEAVIESKQLISWRLTQIGAIGTERNATYRNLREEHKEEVSPLVNRIRQNIGLRKERKRDKEKSPRLEVSQKMREKERIYNENIYPASYSHMGSRNKAPPQEISQTKDYDNSMTMTRVHNASSSVDKSRREYLKTIDQTASVNISQNYERPPLIKRGSIDTSSPSVQMIKPEKPSIPHSKPSKTQTKGGRSVTPVRQKLNIQPTQPHKPQSISGASSIKTDRNILQHNPGIIAPVTSSYTKYRKTEKSTSRREGYSATRYETSTDDDPNYTQELNEITEKVLQGTMTRFQESVNPRNLNTSREKARQKLTFISTIPNAKQQQASNREYLPTIEDQNRDSINPKPTTSPYGGGGIGGLLTENPKPQKHQQTRQKMQRIKSEEGMKQKSINYTDLILQTRKPPQEIEDERLFTEVNKTSTKYEFEYIPRNEKLQEGNVILTNTGVIEFTTQPNHPLVSPKGAKPEMHTNILSHNELLLEKTLGKIFTDVPFFKHFKAFKLLRLWRAYTRRMNFLRKTAHLKQSFVFNQAVFFQTLGPLNLLTKRISDLEYLSAKPKTTFLFFDEFGFKRTQDAIGEEAHKEIKKIAEDFLDFMQKAKTSYAQHVANVQRELDENVSRSALYKTFHIKEHLSAENANLKLREEKTFELKKLNVQFHRYQRIVLMSVISNLIKMVIDNETRFANATVQNKGGVLFEIDMRVENGKLELRPQQETFISIVTQTIEQNQNLLMGSIPVNRVFDFIIKTIDPVFIRNLSSIGMILHYISNTIALKRKDVNDPVQNMIKELKQDYTDIGKYDDVFRQYEEVNQKMTWIHQELDALSVYSTTPVEKNLEIMKLVKWLHEKIHELISAKVQIGNTIQLNFGKIQMPLQARLDELIVKVQGKYIEHVEQDLSDVKFEIIQATQKVQADPQTIEEYIDCIQNIEEFITSLEVYKNKVKLFDEICKYIDELMKRENTSYYHLLREARDALKKGPDVLRTAVYKIQRNRRKTASLTQKSFKEFNDKVNDFKKRYINSYFKDKQKIDNPETTYRELEQRDGNIADIRQRLAAYLSFNSDNYVNRLKEKGVISGYFDEQKLTTTAEVPAAYDEIERANRLTPEDLQRNLATIEVLHKETKRLWKTLTYWSQRKKTYLTTNFEELEPRKVYHTIAKLRKYLSEDVFDQENQEFGRNSRAIFSGMVESLEEVEHFLKRTSILDRKNIPEPQWREIMRILGFEKKVFTFEMLLKNPKFEQNYEKIQDILKVIGNDAKFEGVISQTFDLWQKEEVPFKLYKDVFLVDKEKTLDIIDTRVIEYKITTEQLLAKENLFSNAMKLRLERLASSLEAGEQVMRRLAECDEEYLRAEILEEDIVRRKNGQLETFLNEFDDTVIEKLKRAFKERKAIIEKVKAAKSFLSDLDRAKAQQLLTQLDELVEIFRTGWQDVRRLLDQKRKAFARLYFLDDMGVIALYKGFYENMDRPGPLKALFPGVWKLEMREEGKGDKGKQLGEVDPQLLRSSAGSQSMGMKHASAEERRRAAVVQNKEEIAKIAGASNFGELRLLATKEGINAQKVIIEGLVDSNYETLKLKKPISIKNKKIEDILKGIENEMQETILEDLNIAINTFPNHSLDEWIMGFPTQVVITSLHLIVTHEIYEMIKVLQACLEAHKKPRKHNISESVSASMYSGSNSQFTGAGRSSHRQRTGGDQKLTPEELEQLREETEIIMHKPHQKRADQVIFSDPHDKVELFGQNFSSPYLGSTKEEMHALLQQRSFRGLFTRLQFWVNLIMKHIYEKKEGEEAVKKLPKNIHGKYCNVLSFILFLRDMVLDVYDNSTDTIPDFEWNKHIRMVLEGDNKACIIECGGWAGYQGNEFIGGASRLMITPITEKYLIFISSALREKSAITFRTVGVQDACGGIVEDFANLCTIPMQTLSLCPQISPTVLLSYVNAGAYANTWVTLEHIDALDLIQLSLLCKEVQLVQQKVIIADLQKSNDVPDKVVLNLNQLAGKNQEDLPPVKRVSYGLFCSLYPHTHNPKIDRILLSCFRCTSLLLPDFEYYLKNTLYIYGFDSFIILTKKIMLFKNLIEEKVLKSGTTFLTEQAQNLQTKPFIFKHHEILSLLEQFKKAKDHLRGEYDTMIHIQQQQQQQQGQGQGQGQKTKPLGTAKFGLMDLLKGSPNLKETKSAREDAANVMKNNTEDDINQFESLVVACVLAQYTLEKLREYLKLIMSNTEAFSPQDYISIVSGPLYTVFKADKPFQDFITRKLLKIDLGQVCESLPYVFFPRQAEQVNDLYHALSTFGVSLIYGEAHTGKSSVVTLLQKYLEKMHSIPSDNFNIIRLNTSLLSVPYTDYNDALHYLTSKLKEINQADNINFIILDGEPNTPFWDLLTSIIYTNKPSISPPLVPGQLTLDNWPHANDFHRSSLKKLHSNDGKIYFLEANTFLVAETTSLMGCTPSVLGSIGLVSTRDSVGIEDILEIYDKKLRSLLHECIVFQKKQLFDLFVNDFWEILATFEKDYLSKIGSFSLRGIVLTWLKYLTILLKDSPLINKSAGQPKSLPTFTNSLSDITLTEGSIMGDLNPKPEEKDKKETVTPAPPAYIREAIVEDSPKKSLEFKDPEMPERTPRYEKEEEEDLEYNKLESLLPSIAISKEESFINELRGTESARNVELLATIALLWTLHGVIPQSLTEKFNKELIPTLSMKLYDNMTLRDSLHKLGNDYLFEHFFDSEKHQFVKVAQTPMYKRLQANPVMIDSDSFFIPNARSIQALWLMKKMVKHGENLVILGPRGTGKTALAKFLRKELSDPKEYPAQFLEAYQLKSHQMRAFYNLITNKMEQSQTFNLAQKSPLIFIEDLSLDPPSSEIDVLDFLRFWKLGDGFMDLIGTNFKNYGKPRCLLMMREDPSQGEAEYERRFYFESLKLNYNCLDSEREFSSIFSSIIQNQRAPSCFLDFKKELTSLSYYIIDTLEEFVPFRRNLHGKIINFLRNLVYIWQPVDSLSTRENARKNFVMLVAAECKSKMLENLMLEPRNMSEIYEELLQGFAETFNFEGLNVKAFENIEVIYPNISLPNRLNAQLLYTQQDLYKALQLQIKTLTTTPVSSFTSSLDDNDLFIQSVWDLYKTSKNKDSHFCFLSSPTDFIDEFFTCLSQFNQIIIKRELFTQHINSWKIMKEVVKEIIDSRKAQTHILIVITEEELRQGNLKHDLLQWVHQGLSPLQIDPEFEQTMIQNFKKEIQPENLFNYVRNKDPNQIDDSLILQELKRHIRQRLHFCLHIQNHQTLKELELLFPDFKANFKAIYPFYSQAPYTQRVLNNLKAHDPNLISKSISLLRDQVLGKVLSQQYIDSLLTSEKLAASYESSGVFDKYDYFELIKTKIPKQTNAVDHYLIQKNPVFYIDEEYFSLRKFILVTNIHNSLFKLFSSKIQANLTLIKDVLRGIKTFSASINDTKDNKTTITFKALSMGMRMREIDKQLENCEAETQNRKGTYMGRQEEINELLIYKKSILISFAHFAETQHEKITEIISKLHLIDNKEFESIDNKALHEPKRIYNMLIIVYTSLFDHQRILTENARDRKSALNMLKSKESLIKRLEKNAKFDEKTFVAPNLKILDKLSAIFGLFVSIKEDELSPLMKVLHQWCIFWYSQVHKYYEMQAKQERLNDIEKKIGYNQSYLVKFDKHIKSIRQQIAKLQEEKEILHAQDDELNLSLAVAEVESNKFEIIDKIILTLERKFARKQAKLEEISQTLSSDLLIVILDLVYLGVLDKKSKLEVLNQIASALNRKEEKEIGSVCSEKWTYDSSFLEKYIKSLLKCVGKERLCKRLQFKDDIEKLSFCELMLLEVIETQVPESKEFMSGRIVAMCNLGLETGDIAGFIEKKVADMGRILTKEKGKSEENTMVKYYGANINSKFEGDLMSRNMKNMLELEKKARDIVNNNIVIGFNELNLSDAWIEMKKIFWEAFIPEDSEKYHNTIHWCFEIEERRRTFLEEFVKLVNKEQQNLSQEQILKKYKAILEGYDLARDDTKEMAANYENLVNSRPLLSSYSNILIIVFQSYKQYFNIIGRRGYTWKHYLSIIKMIIKKLLRDISGRNSKKAKKSKKPTEEAKREAGSDEDEILEDEPKPKATKPQGGKQGKRPEPIKIEDDNLPTARKASPTEESRDGPNGDEVVIDEEFFADLLLPSVIHVLTASMPIKDIPLFNLLLSMNVGVKRDTIESGEIELITEVLIATGEPEKWKTEDITRNSLGLLNKESADNLVATIRKYKKEGLEDVFEKLYSLIPASRIKEMELRKVVHELLKRKEMKDLKLNEKMVLSLFSVSADLKSIFQQFIFEEFISIFDYQQEDLLKIHSFIKVASWHVPIAIFCDRNLNIINTVCSIASFYGVDISVIEVPKKDLSHKQQSNLKNEALNSIRNAAVTGSWVLVTDFSVTEYWKDIVDLITALEAQQVVVNSFRILFDFQDVEYAEIPIEFITENAIIYHLGEDNMEDMEGFNDVWANLLENIVNVDNIINITMSEKEDSSMAKVFHNLKLGANFHGEHKGQLVDLLESKKPDIVNYSVDEYVREDILSISNLSVIKKMNESKGPEGDSILEANQKFLDQIQYEESFLEATMNKQPPKKKK